MQTPSQGPEGHGVRPCSRPTALSWPLFASCSAPAAAASLGSSKRPLQLPLPGRPSPHPTPPLRAPFSWSLEQLLSPGPSPVSRQSLEPGIRAACHSAVHPLRCLSALRRLAALVTELPVPARGPRPHRQRQPRGHLSWKGTRDRCRALGVRGLCFHTRMNALGSPSQRTTDEVAQTTEICFLFPRSSGAGSPRPRGLQGRVLPRPLRLSPLPPATPRGRPSACIWFLPPVLIRTPVLVD